MTFRYLNKQDMEDAIDEIDICKFTNLEELVSQYKCITKIVSLYSTAFL